METKQLNPIRIGTSGIVLPVNKVAFPEEFKAGTRLHYYGSLFNTLEVNSSFYKIPKFSTFEKWSSEVPDDFLFTVKLWRGITHAKKLEYSLDDLNNFMRAANGVGSKKGCLLIQFPASIRFEYLSEIEKMLEQLAQHNEDESWKFAVELRHKSWYQESAYTTFAKYKTSLVLHDMPNSQTPLEYLTSPHAYSTCLYVRFHGPTGHYDGSYSNQLIDTYAERIKEWRASGKETYVYFNNTMGSALQNAQRLQKKID
ncbi:MAG: DUF72 domain-containing protein [Moraxellaceae bacterium]|nr:MAG: DUF72 domain-containing protein [Moraxellaceae bacterium]